jgi:3-dehydroquinate synthase
MDLSIKSINGYYRVHFIDSMQGLLSEIDNIQDSFVLADRNLQEIYKDLLFPSTPRNTYFMEATESNKSLEGVLSFVEWMMDKGATKSSTIIAVGGGVIQDIATFSSHIYYRGVDWIYVPTTLLSQADSCIGSKCALNLKGHKNQLGVIHTPKNIYICSQFLETLPTSEIQSGFGEIAKLSVTGPNYFYEFFKEYLDNHGFGIKEISGLIRNSLLAKKIIIEEDEYELGPRRILNYGHSFGHAIESLSSNRIVHGDAVLIGMELINFLGKKWGITNADFAEDFERMTENFFPAIQVDFPLDANNWVMELRKDKKMRNGRMNFAIPRDLGDIIIVERELDDELICQVREFMNESKRFHTS